MGQVIDLPDPMHNAAPAAGPGVDDLLAQLAGDEIDRLLAEADIERSVPPTQVLTPPADFSPTAPPLAEAPSAADLAPTASDPAISPEPKQIPDGKSATSIAEADVEELDARVAKELNTLFTELDSEQPSPAAAQAAPAPAPALAAAAATAEATTNALIAAVSAPPSDPVAHAQELERQVLGKTLLDALGGPLEIPTPTSRLRSINLSFLLRPLEWLNAPLNACSDTVRESLGKVAIMTLINALAILLYVMFLRKH